MTPEEIKVAVEACANVIECTSVVDVPVTDPIDGPVTYTEIILTTTDIEASRAAVMPALEAEFPTGLFRVHLNYVKP